jgi:hypothetical protein
LSRNPFSAGGAESEEEEGVKKRKLREKEIAAENTSFFVFMIKQHLSVESTCSEDKPSFGRTAKALAFHIFARFLRMLCVAF